MLEKQHGKQWYTTVQALYKSVYLVVKDENGERRAKFANNLNNNYNNNKYV